MSSCAHPGGIRKPAAFAALFIFCAAFGAGCRKSAERAAKPNVLIITVDTLRADRLGVYGNKDGLTPNVDALAKDGVVFEHAIAQVPLTWPSHAAIFTGTYPFHNGVEDFTGQPLSDKFRTLAESFKGNGYATGAVVSSFVLDRSWGLGRGFDYYDDAFSGQQFVDGSVETQLIQHGTTNIAVGNGVDQSRVRVHHQSDALPVCINAAQHLLDGLVASDE